ncbi:GntR family transcriptional regulator [Deinococcus sp. AJ005]|uniref:GntR family transcriptional regulator n=1 Tax=Deinococcus sp. AJ005 TaxID=2652443 RepID=UPI00186580A1|nr:GntR family transcriptional regulator [Deinococcus sp. AJ005]
MSDTPPRRAELLTRLASQVKVEGQLPVYLQLRQALTEAIGDGVLEPGASLPAVRALASALGLAPNTVAKTYALLQEDGLTENRAGAGTRVRPDSAAGQQGGLLELRRRVRELKAAGISDAELRAVVDEELTGEPSISVCGTQSPGRVG